jgi:hypothetical protein
MKKSSRREHPNESAVSRASRANAKNDGRWEFTSSGRLFPVGSTDGSRRAAYWTASGELRFLPL